MKFCRSIIAFLGVSLLFAIACQSPDGGKNAKPSGEPSEVRTTGKPLIETVGLKELLRRFEKDKKAELYVYNFWATWCKPCVKELPYFEKLNADYASKGVKVVLVSLDEKELLEGGKLTDFVRKKQLQSELLLLDAGNPNKWG